MKKILTLALAVLMLATTLMFTSCDVNSIMEMIGGSFGSATTPAETTPEETTPPAPKRHTITEEEWIANMNSANFIYVRKQTYQGNTVTAIAKMTETAGEIVRSDLGEKFYWALLDGKVYSISKDEQTNDWVASFQKDEWFTLGNQLEMTEDYFDLYLKYNEETKSYIYETEGVFAEFYFENGKLIKGTIENVVEDAEYSLFITIENVGTTVVTLPEYTFEEE